MPNVFFNLKTLVSGSADSSDVTPYLKVVPTYAPFTYSGSIVLKDSWEQDLDADGTLTVSNIFPNVYHVQVWTKKIETEFDLLIPSNTSGTVNAVDYIVNNFTGSFQTSNFIRIVSVPSSMDDDGAEGQMAFDSNYSYVYTSGGWKRSPIAQFS